jgi:hypothetical protein
LLGEFGLLCQASDFNLIVRIDSINSIDIIFVKVITVDSNAYILDYEGNIYFCLYHAKTNTFVINKLELDGQPPNIINMHVLKKQ